MCSYSNNLCIFRLVLSVSHPSSIRSLVVEVLCSVLVTSVVICFVVVLVLVRQILSNVRHRYSRNSGITTLHTAPHPPLYYTLGTKLGNTLHTQLRLGMSRLNAHQYAIQKITDPACACGHNQENTNHFILDCPLFTPARTHLFRETSLHLKVDFQTLTNTMKINILLFGLNTREASASLVSHEFQKYLQHTNRFT